MGYYIGPAIFLRKFNGNIRIFFFFLLWHYILFLYRPDPVGVRLTVRDKSRAFVTDMAEKSSSKFKETEKLYCGMVRRTGNSYK